jgi:hypothetical protein
MAKIAIKKQAAPVNNIADLFKKNPFLIIIAGIGLLVIFMLIKGAGGAKSAAQAQPSATPGTQNVGLPGQSLYLAFIPTQAPASEIVPTGVTTIVPPTPSPQPTPTPIGTSGALIPKGQWPSSIPFVFGRTINVGGTTYTLGPGSGGRVWGVPGTGLSLAQWNNVPIGPGQKTLLYQG